MRIHNLLVIAVSTFLLALAACSDSGDNPTNSNPPPGGNSNVSFATDIQPILQGRCAIPDCHGSGAIKSGLNMATASHATITAITGSSGTKFVTAGNANASTFYLKTKNPPSFGSRMPASGSFLTDAQILNIQTWINDGAPDN